LFLITWISKRAKKEWGIMVVAHWMHFRSSSYPGLLTPAFVARSTNTGEGLVKLSHVQWRTWTCGGVAHSRKYHKWVHYQLQTWTVEWLSDWHQTVLVMFLGFIKLLYRRNVPLLHTSKYVTAHDSVKLPSLSLN